MRILCLIFLCCPFTTQAQVLSSSRSVDWSPALRCDTFSGILPYLDIMDFGGINDSSGSNHTALSAAFAHLSGQPGILHFPAGTYLFNSSVQVPPGVRITGSGADSTKFYFDLGGVATDCFRVSGGSLGTLTDVLGGHTRDSYRIIVSDPYVLHAGIAEIRQANGSWNTNPASWAEYSVGQVIFIDSVAGDTAYLQYPLRIDYDPLLQPEVRMMQPALYNTFECFYMQRVDQPVSGAGYNILFERAAHGKVEGVYSYKSVGSHVMLELSTNIQVKGSYFYDAFTFDGSGTRGYGVTINNHSGQCLVENNMFRRLRHAMMVKHGANGNVFAYNYSREPNRSEPVANYSADISLHGHYPYANLFEGNIVQFIMIDHYWGPSGPYNTFLRNRAESFGIVMTSGTQTTASQNFIGNETTNSNLLMGNFTLAGNDHFSHGNNILGNTIPPGTSALADSSYYRDVLPLFWYIQHPWPSVGYPHTGNLYSNPARERYTTGIMTLCSETQLGYPTLQGEMHSGLLLPYPNPTSGMVFLPEQADMISVITMDGKMIMQVRQTAMIDLSSLPAGLYFVQVSHGYAPVQHHKILKTR